ncbi:MoaD/ThiS family protein [Desulfonema magnum]|uniref:Sulfur carrier ThiS/MoaD-like family protein n=1 Tax=Desulfonema magnum TaxID=45655 RepID=A0A975GT48_9BACT|nr:MoaD/ThiS family protein [Desulfonema magnum]QTA92711.1 Sulfur carrier ThiS/MoaD-like family protein [Desulfonema magnum]
MEKHIEIKLFATLSKFLPPDPDKFPISPGIKVRDVIRELKVPPEDVRIIFINSVRKDIDTVLQGGERVGIFPPLGGG